MDLIYPTCCIFLTFFGVLQHSVLAVSIWCYFSMLIAQERVTYFAKPWISGTHQPVVLSALGETSACSPSLAYHKHHTDEVVDVYWFPKLARSTSITSRALCFFCHFLIMCMAGGHGLAALPFVCVVDPDMI